MALHCALERSHVDRLGAKQKLVEGRAVDDGVEGPAGALRA
jgi:hypothetical protein